MIVLKYFLKIFLSFFEQKSSTFPPRQAVDRKLKTEDSQHLLCASKGIVVATLGIPMNGRNNCS